MEDAAEQLQGVARSVGECAKCRGLAARRQHGLPGSGHPHCRVMVVSLQPDPADEAEEKGAGSTVVERLGEFMPALAHTRDELYVTTLLKCPARNGVGRRAAMDDELDACFPFVSKEISITTPHYILTVGERTSRYMLARLFKNRPYGEGDSLELRVFDNPAFSVVPVAEPDELRERPAREREGYADRLTALAKVMGL